MPKKSRVGPAAVLAAIREAESTLLTGHINPDGDSLGSMVALAHLLNQNGHKAVATADKMSLGGPSFLNGIKKMISPATASRKKFDLIIALDCGSFDRLPEPLQPMTSSIRTLNIDHHHTNTRFADLNWVDSHAAATGEMIWRLARHARWQLDNISAEALWVALITDTGRFAYDQTTATTLRCGADLVKHGVRTAYINDKLYCSFSRIAMELKKRAFRTLVVSDNNRVASVSLTGRDFRETGGTKADAEDVIEIPRSLKGNVIALFYYGSEDENDTKVSIRTRAPLDATELAANFGGGGHVRAAGCTINEPLSVAKRSFERFLAEWLKSQPHC